MTVKESWKPVTIGGLTGILMGAGAMYGVQTIISDSNEAVSGAVEEGIRVASVDESLSFAHAFESARAQVGPGGVFTWHGHIYNTYTVEEWGAMSSDDKQLFASQVKPEVSAADVDTKQVAESSHKEVPAQAVATVRDDDVQIAESQEHDVEIGKRGDSQVFATTWNDIAQEENDVRVVGFKEVEIGHGRSIAMQELDVNGQRVAIIDVDKDGDPDLAMTDLNHNEQMDEGEVIDLHTGEAISFANDEAPAESIDIDTFNA